MGRASIVELAFVQHRQPGHVPVEWSISYTPKAARDAPLGKHTYLRSPLLQAKGYTSTADCDGCAESSGCVLRIGEWETLKRPSIQSDLRRPVSGSLKLSLKYDLSGDPPHDIFQAELQRPTTDSLGAV